MDWNVLNYILLFVYVTILALFIFFRVSKKHFVAQLLVFGALVLGFNTFLLMIPYLYETTLNGGHIVMNEFWINLSASLAGSISLFTFNYGTDAMIAYGSEYPIFALVYILGILDVILITVATVVSFFNSTFVNSLRVSRALRKDNCEIILHYKDSYLPYYKRSKNCVVWVDENISDEQLVALVNEKILVIKAKFSLETLSSSMFNSNTNYDFVLFNEDNILETLNIFSDLLKLPNRQKFFLHADVSYEHSETLIKQIVDPNEINANVFLYSKEELLARQFVISNPYTKYLPKGFIKEDTLMDETKKINVFVLGFDLLNQEVIRASMFTNQFVSKVKNKLKPNLVNYIIFDENATEDNYNFLNDYKLRYEKMRNNKDSYIDLCEEVANISFIPYKQTSSKTFEKIQNVIASDKDAYNFFFVSTGDNYQSINLSQKIHSLVRHSDHHIFTRVSDFGLIDQNATSDIFTYYGDFVSLMTPQVIIGKKLLSLAQAYAYSYNNYSMEERKKYWPSLKFIDSYSNIALAMSTRFKLQLLGYDYIHNEHVNETHTVVSEEEFMNRYTEGTMVINTNIDEYEKPSIRNYLLYQEHLRWNAFHLLNGYEPMETERITYNGKKIVRKDYDLKLHACIITYEGLSKLALYQKDLATKYDEASKAATSIEDLYCFDGLVFTSVYKIFQELGYTIIKK